MGAKEPGMYNKADTGETSEKKGWAHIGFPGGIDTILGWKEVKRSEDVETCTASCWPLVQRAEELSAVLQDVAKRSQKSYKHFDLYYVENPINKGTPCYDCTDILARCTQSPYPLKITARYFTL